MAKSLRRKLREINRDGMDAAEVTARLILDERTRNLAERQSADLSPSVKTISVLVCGAGAERYGIAISDVAEVTQAQPCVPIADAPAGLVGILGRRGHPVSVVDLGRALGVANPSGETVFHHLVLLRREHPRVALRVERAHGVWPVTMLTPEEGQRFRNEAVIGYAELDSETADRERVVALIDVELLLRPFLPTSLAPGV